MRVRFLLTVAIVLTAAFVLAQQSSQQPTTAPEPSAPQTMTMPQQSGQQPMGQSMPMPQQSTQQSMTMSQASDQEPMVKTSEEARFATVPGLPDCITATTERGDPKTGPNVTFVKVTSGCSIPWHWHTANEQNMFVSGSGQVQAKGQQAQPVSQGAFVYMPAQHQHQLTCPNGCTFYRSADGANDVHYVDAAGNEISPETALSAVGEHPATTVSARQ